MSDLAIRELAERLLANGTASLSAHDRKLLEQVARRQTVTRNVNREFEQQLTFGERLSDQVAAVGGSWGFIIAFGLIIVGWVVLNSFLLVEWGKPFDSYPYIFLNLVLSMVAAIQAPIIMMSQNRQADKDRLAAQLDYEVNLRSEIEIAGLHEKLEHLRSNELKTILTRIEAALGVHLAEDREREALLSEGAASSAISETPEPARQGRPGDGQSQ
ncbi:DUF1003 domain-containing protein [Mesorhizobium sp. BR1-1-16]|uniref:DUF1003 domain-containing protein n=1 Tax=Mesorhizobium sp. BR1-1-16 TaxID=2876653 RepID=UPI001CC92B8C|nr:DUF1003 domain-containing protein [Mesorhizobium sp. BR1-1-16]MBZ9936365.1 DUF1003 domain-containing protein [Mesorhizobium sp. BR1-1-16]